MGLLDVNRSLLVIIDLQGKIVERAWRSRFVLDATLRLLKLAELFQVPVVLTEQNPAGLGGTHPEVKAAFDGLTFAKRILAKTSFSCCSDRGFMEALAEVRPDLSPSRRQVVVAGAETHICVMQTVLGLLESGHEVHVSWDAVSGRGEEYRRHALERMAAAGATLTNHESVAFEWAGDKNDPRFRTVNALFREGQLTG
jgi:nicotinamidase-related amidase